MAASQFDYVKMDVAREELKGMGETISDYVLKIAEKGNAAVKICYTGVAADKFIAQFNKAAEDVSSAIDLINKDLAENLAIEKEEYKAQEQKMVESVNVPPVA